MTLTSVNIPHARAAAPSDAPAPSPSPTPSRQNLPDRAFRMALVAAALSVPILVALFAALLIYGAWPSIHRFGISFLFSTQWNPNPAHERYGALAFIIGTLVSSILALCIAGPLGVAVAAFTHEVLGKQLRGPITFLIEILATIPSVVYGLWGIFVLVPWVRESLEPFLARYFGFLPLFRGAMYGYGMLAAILILAIMVLPIIVSISMASIRAVPDTLREAALALGATRWEMIRMSVLTRARGGILGGCILALARAMGETMAITMVIGNGHRIAWSLFNASDTVASSIANQFSEATTQLYTAALIELALVLFIISVCINLTARLLVRHTAALSAAGAQP